MSAGALIGELQWTAVFAANMFATLPEWSLRGVGAGLAAGWIGVGALGSRRRLPAIMLVLALATLMLVVAGGYGAVSVLGDPELAERQRALVLDAVLLMLEGAGLAAAAALLPGWLRRRSATAASGR